MLKRSGRGKRAKRAGRGLRRKGGKGSRVQMASASQTLKLLPDDMGTIYTLYDTNLQAFDRLSTIARAYQFYRFTKLEVRFVPHADTFTQAGGSTVPTLYTLIDRNENFLISASGFDQLRELGVKPVRFDDKVITRSWKPNVLAVAPQDNSNPPTTTGFPATKVSPWLPTNYYAAQEANVWQWSPSTIPHRGLVYGVYQIAPGPGAYQYHIEITAHVEFKMPNITYQLPAEAEAPAPAPSKLLKA